LKIVCIDVCLGLRLIIAMWNEVSLMPLQEKKILLFQCTISNFICESEFHVQFCQYLIFVAWVY
jgi:hypothetical protein